MSEPDKPSLLRRAWSRFIHNKVVGTILAASPLVVAAAAAAAVWNYFPVAWQSPPVSQYAIAALVGLFAGLAIYTLRMRRHGQLISAVGGRRVPYDEVSRELQGSYRGGVRPASVGWCHYLVDQPFDQPATALSTAYGLQIVMLMGFRTPRVNVPACLASICDAAHEGGGWSAGSQRDTARPEVTAVVASVLARLREPDQFLTEAIQTIEQAITSETDPLAKSNTYVVATILENAPSLTLNEDLVADMIGALVDGAAKADGGGHYWTDSLSEVEGAKPSTALTAQAVIALQAVVKAELTTSRRAVELIEEGLDWLSRHADLAGSTSRLVRPMPNGKEDINAPRHFTAALVLTSLVQGGRHQSGMTHKALVDVWDQFGDGVWMLDSGERPTWMTYVGLRALIAWSTHQLGSV